MIQNNDILKLDDNDNNLLNIIIIILFFALIILLFAQISYSTPQEVFTDYRHSWSLGFNTMFTNHYYDQDMTTYGFLLESRYRYQDYEDLVGFYLTIGFLSQMGSGDFNHYDLHFQDKEVLLNQSKQTIMSLFAATGPSICLYNDFPMVFIIPSLGIGIITWQDKIWMDQTGWHFSPAKKDGELLRDPVPLFQYYTPWFLFQLEGELLINEYFGINLYFIIPIYSWKGGKTIQLYPVENDYQVLFDQNKYKDIQNYQMWGFVFGIAVTFHYRGLYHYILESDEMDNNLIDPSH